MARMRLYPGAPKPPTTLGEEGYGVIESVGKNITKFQPGDRVMVFSRYASYATHICTSEDMVMPLPNKFSFEEGAAFPVVYITAYMMIFDLGNFRKGETILIHGAGGGVGTAAIQLTQTIGGNIIGTASRWKHQKLKKRALSTALITTPKIHIKKYWNLPVTVVWTWLLILLGVKTGKQVISAWLQWENWWYLEIRIL